MFTARAICGLTYVTVAALFSGCSLHKYLERWPTALYEAGQSALMLMKGSKILRSELNTVHLYQHYSLVMPNKLQYTWHENYCECVRPAQLLILTEVRALSILEQHPWCVPHRDRRGYKLLLLLLLLLLFVFVDLLFIWTVQLGRHISGYKTEVVEVDWVKCNNYEC